MTKDVSKTIIRIIQDYCFSNAAQILNSEFIFTILPSVFEAINDGTFSLAVLNKIAKKRMDFFHANDLHLNTFCEGLYKKLSAEFSLFSEMSFHTSILEFKRKIENGNFRGFPKEKTSEDTLRSTLTVYIPQETFCEARSGSGNSDIAVPSEKTIIETKLWKGEEYYQAGFPELTEYLDKSGYTEGYYIIFDYNKTPNKIINANGETFDINYQGKLIHIIFVRMNAVRPSKKYSQDKTTTKINQV